MPFSSSALHLLQRARHFGDQCRPFVDEAGVDLHNVGPGFDFRDRVMPAQDAAHADDGEIFALGGTQAADHAVAAFEHR